MRSPGNRKMASEESAESRLMRVLRSVCPLEDGQDPDRLMEELDLELIQACVQEEKELKELRQENSDYRKQLREAAEKIKEQNWLQEIQLKLAQKQLERAQLETDALSIQVRELLRSIEKLRGGGLEDQEHSETDKDPRCFQNVDELQALNLYLLAAVKDTKSQIPQAIVSVSERLKGQLATSEEELERLKKLESYQKSVIEAVSEQRDKYKSLFEGVSAKMKQLEASANIARRNLETGIRSAADHFQKEFESFRNEKRATEKILNEKIARLETNVQRLEMENLGLRSEQWRVTALEQELKTTREHQLELLRQRSTDVDSGRLRCQELMRKLLESSETIGKQRGTILSLERQLESTRAMERELWSWVERCYSQEASDHTVLIAQLPALRFRLDVSVAEELFRLQTNLEAEQKKSRGLSEEMATLQRRHREELMELKQTGSAGGNGAVRPTANRRKARGAAASTSSTSDPNCSSASPASSLSSQQDSGARTSRKRAAKVELKVSGKRGRSPSPKCHYNLRSRRPK